MAAEAIGAAVAGVVEDEIRAGLAGVGHLSGLGGGGGGGGGGVSGAGAKKTASKRKGGPPPPPPPPGEDGGAGAEGASPSRGLAANEPVPVEEDAEWLAQNGPASFKEACVGGQWHVFEVAESGATYYVYAPDGTHTWDCPPEVAAELKARQADLDPYAHEGLGADFEVNHPWVPPSAKRAEAYKRREVFGGGRSKCCSFNDDDFAQLGVGIALYFKTLKALSAVFCVMTALSLPMWAIYFTGSRMQARLPDPMRVGHLSVGNVGPLTYDAALTLKATFACPTALNITNATATAALQAAGNLSALPVALLCELYANPELVGQTFFKMTSGLNFTLTGEQAAYVLTFFDFVQMVVLLLFVAILGGETSRFLAFAERKNISAADFSVYVRGLPKDVTADEVRDHFSRLFALDGSGVDVNGKWSEAKNKVMVERTHAALQGGGPSAASNMAGVPKQRPAGEPVGPGDAYMPTDPKALRKAAAAAKKSIDRRRRVGLMTDADPDVSFADRVETVGRGAVAVPSNTNDVSFTDSWVADVALVRRSNKLLTTLIAAEATTERLREARARVKMWSPDTPLKKGGNDKKRQAAIKVHDQLGSQLAMMHEGLRRHYGKKAGDGELRLDHLEKECVGSAFVTFNCEESRSRCLIAYNDSPNWLLRAFQSPYLRFRCPATPGFKSDTGQEVQLDRRGRIEWRPWAKDKWSRGGRGYQIIVEAAPDPSDVIHENLAVSARSRFIRQTITGCVTGLLVAVGLIIMIIAQGYSAAVADKTPDLNLCTTELPALFFGGYGNLSAAEHAIAHDFGEKFIEARTGTLNTGTQPPGARRLQAEFAVAGAVAGASAVVGSVAATPFVDTSGDANALPYNVKVALAQEWAAEFQARGARLRAASERRSQAAVAAFSGRARLQAVAAAAGGGRRRLEDAQGEDEAETTPTLSRLKYSTQRKNEDSMCQAADPANTDHRFLLAYRFNFSDVPAAKRLLEAYKWAPFKLDPHLGAADFTPAFDFGTAVPYARTAENFTKACRLSLAQANAVGKALDDDLPTSPQAKLPVEDVGCPDPRLVDEGIGLCPCATGNTNSKAMCRTLPCFRPNLETPLHQCKTFAATTVLGCYCAQALTAYVAELGPVGGFEHFAHDEADTCNDFLGSYLQAQSIIVLSSGMASVVNVILGAVIPMLTAIEGHVSLSDRSRSLAVKVAAAQTVNTGLTAVLVNAALPAGSSFKLPPIVKEIGLLDGDYADFITPWYGTVGTTIVTTALINAFIPPTLMSLEYIFDIFGRRGAINRDGISEGGVVTQAQLDELFVGARFHTPPRYPLVITMVVVSLVYSAGLPMLLPLAAFGFILQYAVDKWMLLRFYRKPPAYDEGMTRLLLTIMPWATLIHFGFATWQFSSGGLPSAYLSPQLIQYVSNLVGLNAVGAQASNFLAVYTEVAAQYDGIGAVPRILRLNTFPLALAFLLLLVVLVAANLLSTLGGVLWALLSAVSCGFVCCRCCMRGGPGRVRVRKGRVSAKVADELAYAMAEFAEHAKAYRRLAVTRAGLLFEALFLRRVRTSLDEEGGEPAVTVVLDCETTGRGKGLAPFTEQFSRVHDVRNAGETLSAAEVSAGWRLQQLDVRTQDDVLAQGSARDFALVQAALAAKVAPKGSEELLAPADALGPRAGHGSVREYARNTLHLSLEPASAASLRGAADSGADDDDEEAAAASKKPAAAGKRAAAAKAAAAPPKAAKRDPRFPSVFLLRKLHLPDEDPKKVLKKLKSARAAGATAADALAAAEAAGKAPGKAKLTWEVISDAGLASYNVRKNPIYAPAFKVMREGQDSMGAGSADEAENEEDEEAAAPKASPAKGAAKSKRSAAPAAAATPSKVTPKLSRRQQQREEEDDGEEGAAEASR